MPVCEIHNCRYDAGTMCRDCAVQQWNETRRRNKAAKQVQKQRGKKLTYIENAKQRKIEASKYLREATVASIAKSGATNKMDVDVLLNRAQRYISKLSKLVYGNGKTIVHCWVCKNPVPLYGNSPLNTAHCSHYYPKAYYWELAYLLENVGLCCPGCNLDRPETVAAMRSTMVQWHTQEIILELDAKADAFKFGRDTGQIKNKPDAFKLLGYIEDLKQRCKNYESIIEQLNKNRK